MIFIIRKYWFFYVCQKFSNKIYTYAVCETESQAKDILNLIESENEKI